jgi:hypothetical protein
MLKVSGEALAGPNGFGIDNEVVQAVAREVAIAVLSGVQVHALPPLLCHHRLCGRGQTCQRRPNGAVPPSDGFNHRVRSCRVALSREMPAEYHPRVSQQRATPRSMDQGGHDTSRTDLSI